VCSAQDGPFSILTNLLRSECEQMIYDGEVQTAIALQSAEERWDISFYYMKESFFTLLTAVNYCEDEPENLEKATTYLDEHKDVSDRVSCSYHSLKAHDVIVESKESYLADNFDDALLSARWSVYHVDEALDWCSFDTQKVINLLESRDDAQELVDILEEYGTH